MPCSGTIRTALVRFAYGLSTLALSCAFLTSVFHSYDGLFRTAGLGDWMDPYFINALLEHWYQSVQRLADPSSPTMFFPVRHTLGYSHGLILYAPFYVPLRAVLHPFQAYNATIFLVMEAGLLCLYALLRRLGLSFVESAVLCAFFVTSQNVTNGTTAVWAQRASVFLIPMILLLATAAFRERAGRGAGRIMLAGMSGLLATLMYVQDFYTAHFAAFFVACFAIAFASVERSAGSIAQAGRWWGSEPRASRITLVVLVALLILTAWIFMYGGGDLSVLHARLALRGWRRPGLLALLAAAVFLWQHGDVCRRLRTFASQPLVAAFAIGAIIGSALFFWAYLEPFSEHRSFPRQEVWSQLASERAFLAYRSFVFVGVLTSAAWIPWFRAGTRAQRYALWVAIVSAFVLIAPLRFGDFSLWMSVVARLPGFAAIRDPKRIIYLYELALVIATAIILVRGTSGRLRAVAVVTMLVLIATNWNRETFDYERPDAAFDRWVYAPISIDPSCRSFFIKGASAEYMSRGGTNWTLYGIDSMFVSFDRGIPTLNGYSAWAPDGWDLWNPPEPTYPGRVKQWIEQYQLTNVCELDMDARTMRPWP